MIDAIGVRQCIRKLTSAAILIVLIFCSIGCNTATRRIAYPFVGLPLDVLDLPFKTVDNIPGVGLVTTVQYVLDVGLIIFIGGLPYWVWGPWRGGGPMGFHNERFDRLSDWVLQGPDSMYRLYGRSAADAQSGIGGSPFSNLGEQFRRTRQQNDLYGRFVWGWLHTVEGRHTSWEYFPYFRAMWPAY